MDFEQIDLAALAATLEHRLRGRPLDGFVRGRTELRDAAAERLGCSLLEAETLVELLVGRGFLRFLGDATSAEGAGRWTLRSE